MEEVREVHTPEQQITAADSTASGAFKELKHKIAELPFFLSTRGSEGDESLQEAVGAIMGITEQKVTFPESGKR